MAVTSSTLATRVRIKLARHSVTLPELRQLREFFATLFYASLKSEESRYVRCDLIWLDPSDPDPNPPARIRPQRWRFIPFSEPQPFTVGSLTKAASASDPRTASFAVYPDAKGVLKIWGLVDQALGHERVRHHEEGESFGRPGLFQARVNGIGHISVWRSAVFLAELKGERMLTARKAVFYRGEVHRRLKHGINQLFDYANASLPAPDAPTFAKRSWFRHHYLKTLLRLLIRIDGYRHGGAVIITPKVSKSQLRLKYGLAYDGLPSSIAGFVMSDLDSLSNQMDISDLLDEDEDEIPVDLYLGQAIGHDDAIDYSRALDAALWLVSLFSRVDGAIVCDPMLNIRGYGAEIVARDDPPKLVLAEDLNARRTKPIELDRYGTRHRSMIRYCWAVKDALGIVLSQDGDVRVVASVADGVAIWEDVLLLAEQRKGKSLPRRPTD